MGINEIDQELPWTERPEIRELVADMEKIYPQPHIPTQEEQDNGVKKLKQQIQEMRKKHEIQPSQLSIEQQRELRDSSNELLNGSRDKLGELHQIMNKRPSNNPLVSNPIDKLVAQETADGRKAGKISRPRSGWGKWNNQTKSEFSNSKPVQRAIEEMINAELAMAEQQDRRDKSAKRKNQ